MLPVTDRKSLPYAALFCEENVWHLARTLVAQGVPAEALWVLVISNPQQQVVMLAQQAAGEAGYVVWDYHVVLLARLPDGDLICDLDSSLPFPFPAGLYLSASFPDAQTIPGELQARVRRIPAGNYLQRFWSDRSHMVGILESERFPPWPPITPERTDAIPLARYRDSEAVLDDGSVVCSPRELMQWLAAG